MAPRISESPNSADGITNAGMPSFLASGAIHIGFEIEECEPVSQREFRMLMAFVVIAAFAFGCIVNGWLF
jgi:hypothetical protein